MFKTNQRLTSPFDFDNAIFFHALVYVWHDDEIVNGGLIREQTDDAVLINNNYYLKKEYEFTIR